MYRAGAHAAFEKGIRDEMVLHGPSIPLHSTCRVTVNEQKSALIFDQPALCLDKGKGEKAVIGDLSRLKLLAPLARIEDNVHRRITVQCG